MSHYLEKTRFQHERECKSQPLRGDDCLVQLVHNPDEQMNVFSFHFKLTIPAVIGSKQASQKGDAPEA